MITWTSCQQSQYELVGDIFSRSVHEEIAESQLKMVWEGSMKKISDSKKKTFPLFLRFFSFASHHKFDVIFFCCELRCSSIHIIYVLII